jgi:hypothetical protein
METLQLSEKLDDAIGRMSDLAKASPDSQKALHFSQAALNLAHARNIVQSEKSAPKASIKKSE